jgi:hypothetical protein
VSGSLLNSLRQWLQNTMSRFASHIEVSLYDIEVCTGSDGITRSFLSMLLSYSISSENATAQIVRLWLPVVATPLPTRTLTHASTYPDITQALWVTRVLIQSEGE